MTDEVIAAFQACLKANTKHKAELTKAEREAFWLKVTVSLPAEWEQLTLAGSRPTLDEALNKFINRQRTRELFQMSQGELSDIASDAESLSKSTEKIGQKIGLALAAVSTAVDREVPRRAEAMLDAMVDLHRSLDGLLLAIAHFEELLPKQSGGPVLLTEKMSGPVGQPFRSFAEVAREAWRSAGLSVGGNGVPDQGFGDFLDAVHVEVLARKIPGRNAMLAELRKTWPGPRIR